MAERQFFMMYAMIGTWNDTHVTTNVKGAQDADCCM